MEKVDSRKDFSVVYTLYQHETLGYLITAFVVQVVNGKLGTGYQRLIPENIEEFERKLDETDKKLVKILYEISPRAIHKQFAKAGIKLESFLIDFPKFDHKTYIQEYIDRRMAQALEILHKKPFFTLGNSNHPVGKPIQLLQSKASILFHFWQNETDTHYFQTIKLDGEKIDFRFKGEIICMQPAWMYLEGKVFGFEGEVDGKKLQPFVKKKFIAIPLHLEEQYYQGFIKNSIQKFDVIPHGFEITEIKRLPQLRLRIQKDISKIYNFCLEASYAEFTVSVHTDAEPVSVFYSHEGRKYRYTKVFRDLEVEKNFIQTIRNLEFINSGAIQLFMTFTEKEAKYWLSKNYKVLKEKNIEILQDFDGDKIKFDSEFFLSTVVLDKLDWFEVEVVVEIGIFKIPFKKFKRNILKGEQEYKLPDGTTVLLPFSWFAEFRHLFEVSEGEHDTILIKKYQSGLLEGFKKHGDFIGFQGFDEFENLEGIEDVKTPQYLQAQLRDYQQAGLNWFVFLKKNGMNGILADDMGLGKTLQTLALLLHVKENKAKYPNLLIMPTSLIYNWVEEIRKFAPSLKYLIFSGTNREKDATKFLQYDLILTSYGIARIDENFLSNITFEYVICDESQIVKNFRSKTSQAILTFTSHHKISLTGTPIENSTMDLWSQMQLLNPGLLGSQAFFEEYYANPIEKKADKEKAEKLKKIIYPFILRRTKDMVAKELPPRVDNTHFCEMTENQENLYNQYKNNFRKQIFENQDINNKTKFNALAALSQLRQIAIHPMMILENSGESGKINEMMRMVEEIIEKGSKVLIFSQYVKLLNPLSKIFTEKNWKHSYIDGSVAAEKRMGEVKKFQEDPEYQIFLINYRSAGFGLNLIAAEYVFVLDPWWNPAVERQAMDRAHRIGQTKTVFTYKFITKNSIEEKIVLLQEKKSALAADLITTEDDFFKSLDMNDLKSLFE